jgi:SAM-dependent methyltransferase
MNIKLKKTVFPIYKKFRFVLKPILKSYYNLKKEPFSLGYDFYKWSIIDKSINNDDFLTNVNKGILPKGYGFKLDERVVEYPFIFSKINYENKKILDAGSTFNFDDIVNHKKITNKDLTIFTFYPEYNNFENLGIKYIYGDLRKMPFESNAFDIVVCQSTIEHINMDNSIYGYDKNFVKNKDFDFMNAIFELFRVLKPNGKLLITFPFGKFENHSFFQQFDSDMLSKIEDYLNPLGSLKIKFSKYQNNEWSFVGKEECTNSISHNPHTGQGKGNDGAAHSRSICLIEFDKKY